VNVRANNLLLTCAMEYGAGGVQVIFRDLVRWLERSGRRVHVLQCAALPGVRPIERVNEWGRQAIYCPMPAVLGAGSRVNVPILAAYLPLTVLHLIRLIRRKRIDLVNAHFLSPHFVHLALAARLTRTPFVLSVHGADIDAYTATDSRVRRLLLRRIVRSADRIVACSAALAEQMAAAFPDARAKTTWVHNAFDDSHEDVPLGASPVPPPFLLCVARHVAKKGIDTLLHAFARIAGELPGVKLVLVGDGPLFAEHEALARRLGVAGHVLFTSEIPPARVAPFIASCAVFVLPSRAEPFGLVVLEAAHYGRPIVATRVGGVPEILTDGVDALLVEPDDPEAMASRILTLLRQPELAARIGARGRETVHTRFLWKDRIHEYIGVYEGGPRQGPMGVNSYQVRLKPDPTPHHDVS
jgi:glycosyltransferase involved in cell wall biosynthesis